MDDLIFTLSDAEVSASDGDSDGSDVFDPDFKFEEDSHDVQTELESWGNFTRHLKTNGDVKNDSAELNRILKRKRESRTESKNDVKVKRRKGSDSSESSFSGFGSDDGSTGEEDDDQSEASDESTVANVNSLKSSPSAPNPGTAQAKENGADSSDENSEAEPMPHPDDLVPLNTADSDSSSSDEETNPAEIARRDAFFAKPEDGANGNKRSKDPKTTSFQAMGLSRPILRALTAMKFWDPTPIQSKTIPVALTGADIVGGAVTGSGKTAAFVVPILERLLHRPDDVPTTRVVMLTPTRELAVQCHEVSSKLATYTNITHALLVGGLSLREQEATLRRTRPDIIVATPGRFIDHVRNTAGFSVDSIEILVLDEADRMLEEGFAEELSEIIQSIPRGRQTMLFSATMTENVDNLIRVGLERPVRLMVDARGQTVQNLVQEFVRLRKGREDRRLACLMHLCEKVFTKRVLIFLARKDEAHRIRLIFGLCGWGVSELHGNMSQAQRLQAIEDFRTGASSFLLATDLASRGLDIPRISTVINYSAPQSADIYLHRIGRTARAGRGGIACTLAGDKDRKVLRDAMKMSRKKSNASGAPDRSVPVPIVKSRTLPVDAVDAWHSRLESELASDVAEVMQEEKEARVADLAERDLKKAENMIRHEKEIASRPRRTWFESGSSVSGRGGGEGADKWEKREKARIEAKARGDAIRDGRIIKEGKKPKIKLSGKQKKRLEARDIRMGRVGRKTKEGVGSGANVGKGERSGGGRRD